MIHLVLLGDSIFDNAAYVPTGRAVIDQLRGILPTSWSATLAAVDGATVSMVEEQLTDVPDDATHLVVSAGGNDALSFSAFLRNEPSRSVFDSLEKLDEIRETFRASYRAMLAAFRRHSRPTVVCTIYDAVPGLSRAEAAGLALFNETILREASLEGLPVVDLRVVCSDRDDYASTSPIEPSALGGAKIARALVRMLLRHDFTHDGCRVHV